MENVSLSKSPQNRQYIDRFLNLGCAVEMLELKLFPNSKEITESFAVYNAAVKFEDYPEFPDLYDKNTLVIVVGDGRTPRTGALFAFLSPTEVLSIDPTLKVCHQTNLSRWSCIDRLTLVRSKVEDIEFPDSFGDRGVLVVFPHSHAPFQKTVMDIYTRCHRNFGVIAMPCCKVNDLPFPPEVEYQDGACLSPHNTIKIWALVT